MSEPLTSEQLVEVLMLRFGFTRVDLEWNRRGDLSPAQIDGYRGSGGRQRAIILVVATAFAGLIAFSVGAHPKAGVDWTGAAIGGAVAFACVAAPFLAVWWQVYRRPTRPGRVKSVTGEARILPDRNGRLFVHVGKELRGRHLRAEEGDELLVALVPQMTLYYSQGWGTTKVHSAEPARPTAFGPV